MSSAERYDINRLLDDFEKWIFKHDYTYRQVRGMTGISESMTCNLLGRNVPLSMKNLHSICRAMGKDPVTYTEGYQNPYEDMTIDELNDLMARIRTVRDRKVEEEIKKLEGMLEEVKAQEQWEIIRRKILDAVNKED